MKEFVIPAILFAALMAIVPYIAMRGSARRLYAGCDALLYALFAAFLFFAPLVSVELISEREVSVTTAVALEGGGVRTVPMPIRRDPSLLFATFVVAKLLLAAIVYWSARDDERRWSTLAAGAFAGAIYLILIPSLLRTPIDGDEPFYLLLAESIAGDRDLDLRNQYAAIAKSVTGRADLVPQMGDPTGPAGEQYSRHEPFLPLLLVPGLLAGGLPGAVATIALFGALLIASTLKWMEEEGVGRDAVIAVFPFFAFGPPILFYSIRIWPEVPAAFFFVLALRAQRKGRLGWFGAALLALVLLKLRFVPVAVMLIALFAWRHRARAGRVALLLPLLLIPAIVVWAVTGNPLNVHQASELWLQTLSNYPRGFFGLLLDGAAGVLFHAPFYLLGFALLASRQKLGASVHDGALAAIPYLALLIPRDEWHGGWSPPLRYLVVFTPLAAMFAGEVLTRLRSSVPGGLRRVAIAWALTLTAAATAFLSLHGIACPWRLFHLANGENFIGEWLSLRFESDFSRLFPSFIRVNVAASVASALLVVVVVIAFALRFKSRHPVEQFRASNPRRLIAGDFHLPLAAMVLIVVVFAASAGQRPGRVVELEDVHVRHEGGKLFPDEWTQARFRFSGGWTMKAGDRLTFLHSGLPSRLTYRSAGPAEIEVGGVRHLLAANGEQDAEAVLPRRPGAGRLEIRVISGELTLDRLRDDE